MSLQSHVSYLNLPGVAMAVIANKTAVAPEALDVKY
jgi:hypothetical protein